MDHWDHNFL